MPTLRVLLVEDNPGDADLVKEALSESNGTQFAVTVVTCLADALAALRRSQFDLVLLDPGLPDCQGIETYGRLRAAAPDVALVVLTGDADEEKGRAAIKLGAQDYVFKGEVSAHLLTRAMHYAVERGNAERALRESERRLKEAQRLGRIGDWEFDLATGELHWSDMVFAIYERPPELGPPTELEEAQYYSADDVAALRDCMRRAVEAGEGYEVEVRLLLPGRRHAHVAVVGSPVMDGAGVVVRVVGTVQDVTRSRRTSTEERVARDVLAVLNRMYGTDAPLREILPLIQSATDFDFVGLHLRGDGNLSYARAAKSPDDAAARGGECRYSDALDKADGHVAGAFARSGSFWANKAADTMTSASGSERLGPMCDHCRALGYESVALVPLRSYDDVIGLLRLADHRPGCIDRELIAFLEALGSSIGLALARRRAERRLVSLSKAAEASGEVIFLTDQDGIITFVNPEFTRLYGFEAGEVVGKTTPRILKSGKHAPDMYEHFWEAVKARRAVRGELTNKTKDGRLLPIESTVDPISDHDGNLLGFVAIQRDITERKRAEMERERFQAALEANAARLGTILDHSPIALWEADFSGLQATCDHLRRAGVQDLRAYCDEHPGDLVECIQHVKIVDVNKHALRVFDVHSKEELQESLPSLVSTANISVIVDVLVALADGQTEIEREIGVRTLAGNNRRLLGRLSVAPGSERTLASVLLSFTDVTELKELEARLRHSQKMEAVGRLAGGVAHDFNNILTVIGGGCTFLEDGIKEGDPLRDEVRTIRNASQSAAKLTHQLLGFSRRQVLAPRNIDLDAEVRGMTKMLKRLLAEDIVITLESASAGAFIFADPGQVEQVIVNLAVNAGDAMPNGGRLTIAISMLDLDPAAPGARGIDLSGPLVRLAVTDTGVGMDAQTRARLFEPFFTTKEPGKGTGLGLATVYGIVQQSGGFVRVLSEPGQGTTVEIYFPRVDLSEKRVSPESGPVVTRSRGETVLVVDDNRQVLDVTSRMLLQEGYRVLVASGLDEARLVAATAGPVHLLLSDIVMPEGGGRDVADAVTASNRAVKILFMSGHTDDEVLRARVHDRDVAFLHKPFSQAALAQRVRQVLDSAI